MEWAATLDGANGKVGTFGQSYGCAIQYLTAALRPPHLATCIPLSGPMLSFENYWYHRGVLELGWMLSYFVNMAEETLRKAGREDELPALDDLKVDPAVRFAPLKDEVLSHLPINDWIERLGDGAPFLQRHPVPLGRRALLVGERPAAAAVQHGRPDAAHRLLVRPGHLGHARCCTGGLERPGA